MTENTTAHRDPSESVKAADTVIRAVLAELGRGPDTDPVLRAREVVAERDALAAILAEAQAEAEELRRQHYPVGPMLRILSKLPADALAAHDAAVDSEARRRVQAAIDLIDSYVYSDDHSGSFTNSDRLREVLGVEL